MDTTSLPMVVNEVNPYKYEYKEPKCWTCGDDKSFRDCPLLPRSDCTLRDLLDRITHTSKFKDNSRLFESH